MAQSLREILSRHQSLGTRAFGFDVYPHPEHDPGVLRRAHLFLAPFRQQYDRALVLFDRDGCGSLQPAPELAAAVQGNLDQSGWAGRSAVTVLDPELEVWLWAESPHVASALGWSNWKALRRWLEENGHWRPDALKPGDPKAAVQAALLERRQPMSTAIYRKIARTVSLAKCLDPAFVGLLATLRGWFPA